MSPHLALGHEIRLHVRELHLLDRSSHNGGFVDPTLYALKKPLQKHYQICNHTAEIHLEDLLLRNDLQNFVLLRLSHFGRDFSITAQKMINFRSLQFKSFAIIGTKLKIGYQ